MTAEAYQNPENWRYDIEPKYVDTPVVLPEFLSREELADAIIEENTDRDNAKEWIQSDDASRLSVLWDSDDGLYELHEIHDKEGVYYILKERRWAASGEKKYSFTDGRFGFSHTYDLSIYPENDPSAENHRAELVRLLKNGYDRTCAGERSKKYITSSLQDMESFMAAEKILQSHTPETVVSVTEAQASDPTIRERAVHHLYPVAARLTEFPLTRDSFAKVFPEALGLHMQQRFNNAETVIMPVIDTSSDLPTLE